MTERTPNNAPIPKYIKADVLDKIKTDIRKKMAFNSFNEGYVLYDDIIEVFDKYKTESEE